MGIKDYSLQNNFFSISIKTKNGKGAKKMNKRRQRWKRKYEKEK